MSSHLQPVTPSLSHVARRRDTVRRLIILLWLVLAVNVIGTIGYMLLESYRLVEALYMTAPAWRINHGP